MEHVVMFFREFHSTVVAFLYRLRQDSIANSSELFETRIYVFFLDIGYLSGLAKIREA